MDKEDVVYRYTYLYTISSLPYLQCSMVYIYTMEYYSAIKKNEILPFAPTWMDLENFMLSEISQRQILYDITYMWNLKNNTTECICKTETDSQI